MPLLDEPAVRAAIELVASSKGISPKVVESLLVPFSNSTFLGADPDDRAAVLPGAPRRIQRHVTFFATDLRSRVAILHAERFKIVELIS